MPGAADRVFKMAEKEQNEHHLALKRDFRLKAVATIAGQLFAFLIGISGILGGVYLVSKDKSITGFSVFFTSLAMLSGIYISNRNAQQRVIPPQKP